MNRRTLGLLGILIALTAAKTAGACDCTLPKNYGNPQCTAAITAALKAQPTTTGASAASNSASNSAAISAATSASTSKATVGNVTASGGSVGNVSATTGPQQQQQQQRQTATGGTSTANNAGNAQSTTVLGSTYEAARIPVATAFAAALTAAPCGIGSTSAGAQTPLIGASFGTTRKDKKAEEWCHKFDAMRVAFMISPLVGCEDAMLFLDDIKAAMNAAGLTCELVFAPVPPVVEYRQMPGTYTQAEMDAALAAKTCPKPTHPKRKTPARTSCPVPVAQLKGGASHG